MKPLIFLLAILISIPAFAADPTGNAFVAPNGNDNWSGTLPAPNAAGTDGPAATLARAQEVAHKAIAAKGKATILVRGGTYSLHQSLSFTDKDSNLTVAAYPN